MLILSIIFTLHCMSNHLLATMKFIQAVAHNSQCLLHKVCVFPSAYQKSMLLIPATNQNLESRRSTNSCNEQNWKALSETMDTFEFKQSCKDYMGSGREWEWDLHATLCEGAHICLHLHKQRWEKVPWVPSAASTQLPVSPQLPGHISRVLVCHFQCHLQHPPAI